MLHYFDRKKEKIAFLLGKYGQKFIYSMDKKFYPDSTAITPGKFLTPIEKTTTAK